MEDDCIVVEDDVNEGDFDDDFGDVEFDDSMLQVGI